MSGLRISKKGVGRNRQAGRGGYTLMELVISSAVGAILVAGLSGSLFIASRSFDRSGGTLDKLAAQEVLGQLMTDLQQAIRFTERTAGAVTFTVPDRTGDGLPETIRYAWGGTAGDPLTYQYNDSVAVTLASGVQKFDLSYLTRMMVAAPSNAVSAGIVFEEFTEVKASSDTTSLAIALPAGTVAGNLLIACVAVDGNEASTLASATGWNVLDIGQEGSKVTFGVWWKLAATTEPSLIQFTWLNNQKALGCVMRFTGHDAVSPLNALATAFGTSSSPVSPAVSPTVGNAMILRLGGFDNSSVTVASSGLAGYTTIAMDSSGSGIGNVSGGAGYAIQTTAGTSGTGVFSLTGAEAYRTVTIAIAPAP